MDTENQPTGFKKIKTDNRDVSAYRGTAYLVDQ